MNHIIQAVSAVEVDAVRKLFSEYAASLEIDLSFQDFARELDGLPGDYTPPTGALLLAFDDAGQPAGCVALRPLDLPRVAELKRLYVRPSGRARGLGFALTAAALDAARASGYQRVRLDTLPSMRQAQRLYERLGFREIGPYRFNPVRTARYMELDLGAATDGV